MWLIALSLNIIFYSLSSSLIKLIAGKVPRAQALSVQFLLCAVFIFLYNFFSDRFNFSDSMLLVLPVGFLNALGAYCEWRAIKSSLSRTSLFYPLANVLTVILAGVFLAEAAEWSSELIIGVLLCFLAAFLFSRRAADTDKINIKEWLLSVSSMILIFGTTAFLMKVFSSDIPREQFLIAWYVGSFLGSLPILFLEKESLFKFPGRSVFLVPLLSLAILSQLATFYWAFQLVSASKVVPLRAVGTAFVPVLIGWFVFKEGKGLSKKELLAFVVGVIGVLLIIIK